MTATQAIALVDLERDTSRRIGQCGPERIRSLAMAEQRRSTVTGATVRETGQADVLVESAPGHDGAERVEEHELGRCDRARRERVEPDLRCVSGEPVEIARQRTLPPSGGWGPLRTRKRPNPGFCSSSPAAFSIT